jgi:DNA (cytosine-5)-methyltransferase 1
LTEKPIVLDLFCGAGGESQGLMQAFRELEVELYAVNHWELAIETHGLNHPEAYHYVEDVFTGTAKKHIRDRRVALLWASPSCTHFSVARGGGPCSASGGLVWRGTVHEEITEKMEKRYA